MVFGFNSEPGMGEDDVEAGASAPSPPLPRPPPPPLSIDEVLQKSVRGFREKWWKAPFVISFEDARAEEAEGDFGGVGGRDMHPEMKVSAESVARLYLPRPPPFSSASPPYIPPSLYPSLPHLVLPEGFYFTFFLFQYLEFLG